MIMHRSCGADVAMFSTTTKLNHLYTRAVKLIFPDATTDQKLKKDENNEPVQTTSIQQGSVHVHGP